MGHFVEFLLLVMFIMFAAGVLQYFLNTPIERVAERIKQLWHTKR